MTDHGETDDPFSLLSEMAETQNRQQKEKEAQCIAFLESNGPPTPDSIRNRMNSLVGEARQRVLSRHEFWTEWRLRRGLRSLFHAAHKASIDISRHDASLGELASSEHFEHEVERSLEFASQKDAVAYCALVFGVRDTLKEICEVRRDIEDEIEELWSGVFDKDISEFFRQLRNNLLHGRVVIPQWQISYDHEAQHRTGAMMYHAGSLIQSGKWNDRSQGFIDSFGEEKVQLSTIVRMHYRLLDESIRKVNDVFARNVSLSEKDFFDIEDSHKRNGRRQWARIMVGQLKSGENPCDYLHKFFDPEALRAIQRRPAHSKEQVDFIMALKAAEIDWDEDLQSTMYRMFGVECGPDT